MAPGFKNATEILGMGNARKSVPILTPLSPKHLAVRRGGERLPLPRQRGTGTTQPHPLAALPGFLTFERAVSRNVHLPN